VKETSRDVSEQLKLFVAFKWYKLLENYPKRETGTSEVVLKTLVLKSLTKQHIKLK
jgi:hypothetical protein